MMVRNKINSGRFKKGIIPWNKGRVGLQKHTKEQKEKMKQHIKYNPNFGMKGKKHSEKTKMKMIIHRKDMWKNKEHPRGMLNKKMSEETKLKMSGRTPWNKGKKGVMSPNWNEGIKTGIVPKTAFKKGNIPWNKGKKLPPISEEHRKKVSGENNAHWCGGKSFEPYDRTFNTKFKNIIRKRDNQVCMVCGKHIEKLKRALDVHHINYDKLLSIPQNCIALCNSCHPKTNLNRSHWITFFQNLLTERYDYKYNEENIVIDIREINNDEY